MAQDVLSDCDSEIFQEVPLPSKEFWYFHSPIGSIRPCVEVTRSLNVKQTFLIMGFHWQRPILGKVTISIFFQQGKVHKQRKGVRGDTVSSLFDPISHL